MATPFKEMYHQGVVTARDASLLGEGEVAKADDCIYRPNDPAIWKAPGRTAYGTVHADTVTSVILSGLTATKTNGFGSDLSSTTAIGSRTVTSSALFSAGLVGLRVYGSGIQSNTYVASFTDSSTIVLSKPATASATVTLTYSTYEPFMFVKGALTGSNATIVSVDSASQLTLDVASTAGTETVVISSPVKAVLYLTFDAGNADALLAYANSRFYSSPYTADTGTFTAFLTGLQNSSGEEHAEAIKHNEAYLVLSPGNKPRRVYYKDVSGTNTLTSRFAGMQPVTTMRAERIAGTWPQNLGNATYFFLVTEVFNPDSPDEVEGTFDGDPQFVTIADFTTQAVRIHRNADGSTFKYNDGTNGTNLATHWRIYMSPGQPLTSPIPAFHLFRRVATVDISQVTFDLQDGNPTTAYVSASAQDNSGYIAYANAAGLIGAAAVTVASCSATEDTLAITTSSSVASVKVGMPVYFAGIAAGAVVVSVVTGSPNTITLDKAHTATITSQTITFGPGQSVDGNLAETPNNAGSMGARLQTFGFINTSAYSGRPVVGVEVRLRYMWDGPELGADGAGEDRGFNIKMTVSGGDTNTKLNVGHRSGQGSSATFGGLRMAYITAGGNGDTWGRTWNTGLQDFVDGTFLLHVVRAASGVYQRHYIDGVEVKVYFSGADVNLDGEEFRTILFTTQIGETVTIGANGPPPSCDTGDIIEGQFVVNDLTQDGVAWASVPDEFEYFPAFYKVNLSSRRREKIMVIRRLGTIGLFFCRDSIKRLNYFPVESDADAQRGRAWEDVVVNHGCVSKRGVVTFDFPGRGILAAYVSQNALMLTDGITCWPANEDLAWASTFSRANLTNAQLEVYPELHLLALYYTPASGAYNTRAFYFSYHPSHLKAGGRLAAIGPVQVRAKSAVHTDLNGASKLLTGNLSDGKVYLEDSGNTSADTLVTITPDIRTRLIYPNDIGGEARLERCWLRVGAHGNSTTGVCTAAHVRQNIGENLTSITGTDFTTDATTLTDDKLVRIDLDNMAESFQLKVSKADLNASFRLHYATLLGEGYGLESNRA